jgi:hypothetical protein
MEIWTDLYEEIANKIIKNIPAIKWVDLWHEQVQYLTTELPFPSPTIFIAFRLLDTEDKGQYIQNCNTQIDLYFFYETFGDTYKSRLEEDTFDATFDPSFNESFNRTSALEYLRTLTDIHKLLHGQSGDNYSSMRRVEMAREDSGGAGNLYRISYTCIVEDASAIPIVSNKTVTDLIISNNTYVRPPVYDENPLYDVT